MTDETDPLRTRTAEVVVSAPGAPPPARDDSRPASRREREPIEPLDAAAISFAREREQVLRRLDHTVSVNRLRLAVSIGLPIWLAALLVDVYVAEIAKEGDLQRFIAVRLAAAAVVVCVMWRLHREPEPSVRQLWFLDVVAFTTVSATVYFALTGRLAFQDDSTLALFAAHLSRPLGSMSAVSPRPIPAGFERVVQRCMAKDPAERFASTRTVLEALGSIAAERAPAPNAGWHEGARR